MMNSPNKDVCLECGGFCCKFHMYPKEGTSKRCREYHDVRSEPTMQHDKYWIMRSLCPHVTEEGLCSIYEDRPQFCRDFPEKRSVTDWYYFCELYRQMPGKGEVGTGLKVL